MGKITALRAQPEQQALRQQLADALKKKRQAEKHVERVKDAIERTRLAEKAARRQVEAANEALIKAQQDYARAVTDAAIKNAPAPVSQVSSARAAIATAEDQVQTLRATIDQLKADLLDANGAAAAADTDVEIIISEMLIPHAKAVLNQAKFLERRFQPLFDALCLLFNERAPTLKPDEYLRWQKSQQPLRQLKDTLRQWFDERDSRRIVGPDTWRTARERLREKADAELPDFAPEIRDSDEKTSA